jgi:3'-5' exoribonuclease
MKNPTYQRLGTTAELPAQLGREGIGLYLLTGITECSQHNGGRYLRLSLEDAAGKAAGIAWERSLPCVERPATPAPVRVKGTVRDYFGETQLHVESLVALGPCEVPSASALLPLGWCPAEARKTLPLLAALEESLTEPLDGFLRQVLLDPRIMRGLLTCRGSSGHHHAYPGGLLVHSTAMLDLADAIARRIAPDDPWSPQLAQIGYLLHDLGKLRSVGETTRPMHPFAMAHEQHTIELLAPHLCWLERRDVDIAAALRHILGYIATPARPGKPAELPAAEIVVMLDQLSAGSHEARSFEHFRRGRARRSTLSQHRAAFPSGTTRNTWRERQPGS